MASLAVVEAPTNFLWWLAVAVTEWGHWFALAAAFTWFPGWRDTWEGRAAAILGLIAVGLFLSPLIRAAIMADDLAHLLPAFIQDAQPRAKPEAPARLSPLSAIDLLKGASVPAIVPRPLTYATKNGQALELDLYSSSEVHKAPAVLVIHGGSWQGGNRADLPDLNRYLAARGYVVASVGYRLAPRWPFPSSRDDVRDAIAFLKGHATEIGLDPDRLALVGRSAGGQLALSVAYTNPDPGLRGVVALYAPADMWYGYANPSNPWVLDSRGILETYLDGNPDQVPAVYDAASPIKFVSAQTVPTLLLHGGRDELVFPAQSRRLAARLEEAARPYAYVELPWATHACDFNFSGPCGQISTYVVERFLAAVLR